MVDKLLQMEISYRIISYSNLDFCIPYGTFPSAEDKQMQTLLTQDLLIKWYVKNPCILHDKI